jgi:hypothetical protein
MAKRVEKQRAGNERRRRHPESAVPRRAGEGSPRPRKPAKEQRPVRSAPRTTPIARPSATPAPAKNSAQAKARAKARKAKAPKIVRPPLRERILVKLSSIDLNPRNYVTRVPFVVLVIGALGIGLAVTLWLSTDAAERSYQLGHAREVNQALLQQKEALERQVLEAQAAPALAESARGLGMIPSRDTAHLVQDPSGTWVVVGTPKPAEGVSPPPLNSPLPEPTPPGPPPPPAPRVVEPRELAVHLPPRPAQAPNPEASVPAALPGLGMPAAPVVAAPGAEVPTVPVPAVPVPAPPAAPAELPASPLSVDVEHAPTSPETRPLPGPAADTELLAPAPAGAPA